jgi:hypothetical protein
MLTVRIAGHPPNPEGRLVARPSSRPVDRLLGAANTGSENSGVERGFARSGGMKKA